MDDDDAIFSKAISGPLVFLRSMDGPVEMKFHLKTSTSFFTPRGVPQGRVRKPAVWGLKRRYIAMDVEDEERPGCIRFYRLRADEQHPVQAVASVVLSIAGKETLYAWAVPIASYKEYVESRTV